MRALLHRHWHGLDRRQRMLRVVAPLLVGLIDGSLSTLAPIFALAYAVGAHAAFLAGLAASLGAAISMGLSEALSDDGELTGRGEAHVRGIIVGAGTFVGGMFHVLPFLIPDVHTALMIAYPLVTIELIVIAWIRRRWLQVDMRVSLVQVTLGGAIIVTLGIILGNS